MERTKVFDNVKSQEATFVSTLRDVMECLVNPINVRDTPFKRTFLSDPVVALSLNLLFEIHKACANFYYALVTVKNDGDIASAYSLFAPSLQLFAQYTAENSKFLNAVERNRKNLVQCMTREINFIAILLEPLNHYPKYRLLFQEFVQHTPDSSKDRAALTSALNDIVLQSEYVDIKLQEEKDSLMLLHLQNQFSGNAVIFTPTRKLLREGDIERIRINKKNEIEARSYYAHLFNDCIVFSTKRITGSYRLHVMFDFKNCEVTKYDEQNVANGFKISPKDDPDKAEEYRMLNEEMYNDWFQVIIEQIDLLKTKRIAKRTSTMSNITKGPASLGVQLDKLGPRCTILYKLLSEEHQFADIVNAINTSMIQPLMDASKGAVLSAALPNTDGSTETSRYDSNVASFEKSANSTTKYQAQMVTDALKEADVLIFLRAAEAIARAVRDFIKTIEQQCTSSNWSESIIIGPAFNSVTAMSLYNQFKSYSSGQQAMLRVLRTPPFAPFYIDVENYLGGFPGTLQEKIELPRKRVNIYLEAIEELFKCTPQNHSDHFAIKASLQAVDGIEKEIVELIRMKKNFEKLLEIQNSLKTFSTDQFVQKIATMERNFLLEGDLKKVCRKKNKPFRFWLFDDYVVYGGAVGTDSFSFNRALDLSKCSIAQNTSEKNAIEIYGAEKSFVVIAPTEEKFNLWFEALTNACAKARVAAGTTGVEAAPLWKPDSESNNCPLCDKPFSFWNRKHHCRKCGGLMCSEHLKNSEIIPHIHKTQKQKICDDCFSGKTKVVAPTPTTLPPAATVPPTATPSPVATTSTPLTTPTKPPATPSRTPPPVPMTPPPAAQTPPPVPSLPPPVVEVPKTTPPPVPLAPPVESTSKSSQESSNPIKASSAGARNVPEPAEIIEHKPHIKPVINKRGASSIASKIASAKEKQAESTPSSGAATTPAATTPAAPPAAPTPAAPPAAPAPAAPPAAAPAAPALVATPTTPVSPPVVPPSVPQQRAAPPPPPPGRPVSVAIPPPPKPTAPPKSEDSSVVKPPPPTPPLAAPRPPAPTPPGAPPSAPPSAPPARSAPPPPMAPPSISRVESVEEEVEDPLRKYKKMKEMLPEGAVRQKMKVDGFTDEDITRFLSGVQISLPTAAPSAAPAAVALKAPSALPPPGPPKMSLMDEIQKGSKLKAVQAEEKPKVAESAGGILGMLAMEMSKRRFNMNVDAEDDDSDSSGFGSDSDSD